MGKGKLSDLKIFSHQVTSLVELPHCHYAKVRNFSVYTLIGMHCYYQTEKGLKKGGTAASYQSF